MSSSGPGLFKLQRYLAWGDGAESRTLSAMARMTISGRQILRGHQCGIVLPGAFLLALVASCDDRQVSPSSTVETPQRRIVLMRDNLFSPWLLVVSAGDTVEWVNTGQVPHTSIAGSACSGNGTWTSPRIEIGDSFILVFDEAFGDTLREFEYYCGDHCTRGMFGTVIMEP